MEFPKYVDLRGKTKARKYVKFVMPLGLRWKTSKNIICSYQGYSFCSISLKNNMQLKSRLNLKLIKPIRKIVNFLVSDCNDYF